MKQEGELPVLPLKTTHQAELLLGHPTVTEWCFVFFINDAVVVEIFINKVSHTRGAKRIGEVGRSQFLCTVKHPVAVGAVYFIAPKLSQGVPFGTQRISVIVTQRCLIDVDYFVDSLHEICLGEERKILGEVCVVTN
ncbi:hypothetical protein DSECCO2_627940 [anaerobic digester metagenome]